MKSSRVFATFTVVVLLVLGGVIYLNRDRIQQSANTANPSNENVVETREATTIIAQQLTVPWGLAFLPDGGVLVTERSGTLKRISDGKTFPIDGVSHVGEGGLMGLTLHPDFDKNNLLYLYLTTRSGGGLTNRVERYKYANSQLSERKVILENIPGEVNHDGGRIAFGPDKKLYITTGDAGNEQSAQERNSLAGKILRLNDDGTIPNDNPFNNPVYSYGHRNPQGVAWDDKGQLWSTEHGRSGVRSGFDELNLIKKGANYGWPIIEGDQSQAGMERPILHSGSSETWAPASLTYVNGSLFFGGLRGETLYQAKVRSNNEVTLSKHLVGEYGRIRTVAIDPEGYLFITTSNTDGRGDPKPGDDKIIKIGSQLFR